MFLLALVYLIILIVWGFFSLRAPGPDGTRFGGIAQLVLFVIIGIVLFWDVLNK